MITSQTYFGSDLVEKEIAEKAALLLTSVNTFLSRVDPQKEWKMTSGYRNPLHNARIGGAASSRHMSGEAIDIADYDRGLAKACLHHRAWLDELDLWIEDMRATKGWVHFQSEPPRSGARFFIPNAAWAEKLDSPLREENL